MKVAVETKRGRDEEVRCLHRGGGAREVLYVSNNLHTS